MPWSKEEVAEISEIEVRIRKAVDRIGPEFPGVTEMVQANELLYLAQQAGMEHLQTARGFAEALRSEASVLEDEASCALLEPGAVRQRA